MIKTRIKKVMIDDDTKYHVQKKGLPKDFFYDDCWWWLLVPIANVFVLAILIVLIFKSLFWEDESKAWEYITPRGIYDTLEEAQEYCDNLLEQDIKPSRKTKPKKVTTYIKYP